MLQLPADSSGSSHASIPVPSRLYNTVPPEKAPLRGRRFTVPDSMSLKGVPTSLSSASWGDLHNGTADTTAAFAQRLIDLGAVIVGKTKSSQLGSGREWADVVAPKNPREDGHQDAGGGPTGAAASLAGYEWLEASTGLDGTLAIKAFYGVGNDGRLINHFLSHRPGVWSCRRSRTFRSPYVIGVAALGWCANQFSVSIYESSKQRNHVA